MKDPNEMTNAELAEHLENGNFPTPRSLADYMGEASNRLRAMPEPPKPEFFAGWKGVTYAGKPVEIFAVKKDRLIGAYFNDNGGERDCWTPSYWNLDGSHTGISLGNDASLRSNGPPEPVTMLLDSDGVLYPPATYRNMVKRGFKDGMRKLEKVKVRVVKWPCKI